jgi:hypothetical protein
MPERQHDARMTTRGAEPLVLWGEDAWRQVHSARRLAGTTWLMTWLATVATMLVWKLLHVIG